MRQDHDLPLGFTRFDVEHERQRIWKRISPQCSVLRDGYTRQDGALFHQQRRIVEAAHAKRYSGGRSAAEHIEEWLRRGYTVVTFYPFGRVTLTMPGTDQYVAFQGKEDCDYIKLLRGDVL